MSEIERAAKRMAAWLTRYAEPAGLSPVTWKNEAPWLVLPRPDKCTDAAVSLHDLARAALEQRRVPEGWKPVPIEPTEGMLQAAHESDREYTDANFGRGFPLQQQGGYDHYVVMLAAAPKPEDDDGLS